MFSFKLGTEANVLLLTMLGVDLPLFDYFESNMSSPSHLFDLVFAPCFVDINEDAWDDFS